ncbi:malectin domain-containing carbohydrate-binding protein [Dyadobacter sandarakinus]|uniref:Ig domain-containing protein n=1 Tax=Dyadobacter sandarakinus TaxID=2747268 RepID=A0ABX7I1E0_9BACT|nr:malectin domain-containing carbohydrate-binding protein [Dyadobacter sandarakinus]QRQ99883.1 putative Ig domain-containing protein [Dyadobacter sandarakinus]
MKKGNSFVHKLTPLLPKVWSVLILIGLIVSVQTSALDFDRDGSFFPWRSAGKSSTANNGLTTSPTTQSRVTKFTGQNLLKTLADAASALFQSPTVAEELADQTATTGTSFSYTIPQTAFADADGDVLTLAATLDNDAALPAWLLFDPATGVFSGTPADAAAYSIKVTASDKESSVSSTFDLVVSAPAPVNHAPVAGTIANQNATAGTAFNFALPTSTFTDSDGDALTYSATLADDSALPAWLSFNAATQTFSGTPSLAATISIKVSATDSKAAASASFDLVIAPAAPVNHAPVAGTIAAQNATAGTPFTFALPASTFTDSDGDALTYSATLADDSALPAWLSFNASTQTFSGTPSAAGSYNLKVSATDGKAAANASFTLAVAAAPVVTCSPLSTLPCDQLAVSLPFNLTFNGNEGGLSDKNNVGTGFKLADAYSGTRASTDGAASSSIIGYEPSKLTVANDVLSIVSNKGLAFTNSNNQINALGVNFPASGKVVFETTIIKPFNGSNSEQGGIWAGLNDKTYVKLGITGNKVELRRELNDVSSTVTGTANTDQRITETITGLSTQTVRLRMVLDFNNSILEGYYSIDGVNYILIGTNYATPVLSTAGMGLTGTLRAGIFASYRSGANAVTYNFDNFSIRNHEYPLVAAPYRINAGGVTRTVDGQVFNADNTYATVTGTTSNSNFAMSGVSVPELYYERRIGSNISYYLPIANGKYTVKLHMVENFQTAPNKRVFDVKVENAAVLRNLDLYVEGGNKTKVAVIKSIDTEVKDGALNIDFTATVDNAVINAIEILPYVVVNAAPVFSQPTYTFSKSEPGAANSEVAAVSATDVADQTLTYSITAGNEAGKFAINGASGMITLTDTVSYSANKPAYALTVTATDNATPPLSATAAVNISITQFQAPNQAPVAGTIGAQSATAGTLFSYTIPAGTFTDADNDAMTYSATQSDDSALPAWLSFNPATQVFSGTPANAGTVNLKVTATDGKASASTTFAVTTNAAPIVAGCPPTSLLPCEQLKVSVPFSLTFNGTEGGLVDKANVGTGFRMADAYSGTRQATDGTPSSEIIGYEPSKLTIANDRLSIVTNKGIAFSTASQVNNNQINALGVGVTAAGRMVFETTVINPVNGNNSEQGGIWAGLNDKTFVKLVVTGNRLEMRRELNDVSIVDATTANTDQRLSPVITGLNAMTVRLRMVLDFANNTLEGSYSTDGVNYVTVGTNYVTPVISIANMGMGGQTIYAGLYATHRNGTTPVTFTFDNFSIRNQDYPVVSAPYRINAGGVERTVAGNVFHEDNVYAVVAGSTSNATYALTGVSNPELYYERRFGANLSYNLPIANGKYTVKLHMVENFQSAANKRVFDVKVENATVLKNLDLFVEGGNLNKVVIIKSIDTEVTDGALNIDFTSSIDNAVINAIEILPAAIPNKAPVFASSAFNFSKAEDADLGAEIGTVTATDTTTQTVSYAITAGNGAGKFVINASTGVITLAGALDFATTPSYALTVTATDNGTPALSSTATVNITVIDVEDANHAPVVNAPVSNQTLVVNTNLSFTLPANTFTDPDNNQLSLTATLVDGSALPAWLSFNAATQVFSGTPTVIGAYTVKLTASDSKKEVSTQFTITVTEPNRTPVVISAPEAQTITAGQAFSIITGSFSDPDAGDVLTYSATLENGDALPAWLHFSSASQNFTGTAPAETGTLRILLSATDHAQASASAVFDLKIEAAPASNGCSPISTLPCDQVNVTLPFAITFDGQEGGVLDKSNVATGFTMIDAYTGTRLTEDGTATSSVIGYEPSKLTIANGRLTIVANKGIGFATGNNQINALGVGFPASGKLVIETTVINPFNGTSSQQGGLWFGLNDKTFIKLAVTGNKVEMRKELNDVSSTTATTANPDQRITDVISGLNNQTVRLRLVADLSKNTLEGFYSTDGVNYINVGTRYTSASNPAAMNISSMALNGKTVYAGVYASYRNATTPASFTFDSFSVQAQEPAKTLTFTPNALDLTAVQGQAVTATSTTLTASTGTPAVTFTNSTASWLTLPAAATGTVTFGPSNFSTTMAPGIYEATVTATADGYEPAQLLINLTVTSSSAQPQVKVNFQDPNTVPPTGWVRDYGQGFGPRTGANQGSNLEYGWRKPAERTPLDLSVGGTIPGNGRKRTTPADVTLATFMHMQANTISGTFNGTKAEGLWEMKVPNGIYEVTVSVGDSDPGTVSESHSINVEGVSLISKFVPSGTAGTATRFKSAKATARVLDGYLTIDASGGTNTKINSAIITPIDLSPYLVWSASEHSLVIETGTTDTDKTFSLDISHSTSDPALPIALNAVYNDNSPAWLTFNATHNGDEPNVTFNYSAARNLPEGLHTAVVTASANNYISASVLIRVTVLAPGANQPYVVSSSPANGATNVSVNLASVAANNIFVPEIAGFKGGVDKNTVNAQTVKLYKMSGDALIQIPGTFQGTGGGDAISITPEFALEINTKYKFMVTSGVKSFSGASFLPYEAIFTTGSYVAPPANPVAAEFAPKVVIPGTVGKKYTSVLFGPDGRFYALRLDGVIERFTVDHETGMLSNQTEIKSLTNKYGARSSVGLTFDPTSTADNLVAWISHCSAGLTNAPEFDGNISRLSGANLENEQLVLTKLPRSKADHLVNSIAFGPDGALYYNQGSLSSMGLYDATWQRDESLLAATVMRLDLKKLSGMTLPLDVRTTSNQALINAAPADNIRLSDGTYNPYATNSPLTIYASGVRNAFDLLWHSNGQLYVPANGSAAGGNSPESVIGTRRPDGSFYSGSYVKPTNGVVVQNDWLFRVNPIKPVGYYGHPNPLRGEYVSNRGYIDNPKYDAGQGPDVNYRGAAYNFELNKSPNGVIEYKSNAFNGAMKGRILVCRFSGGSDIIVLQPGSMTAVPDVNSPESDDRIYDIIGAQTGSGTNGITGLSGFTNPLDLTEDVQTGNLYVIEYNWNNNAGKTSQIVMLKATSVSAPKGIASVTPAEIVDNDVVGGAAGTAHTVRIANTGNANLTVTSIELIGANKDQFQLLGAPAPTAASPMTVLRGSASTFNIVFNPTSAGVKTATLRVTSVDNEVSEIVLRGLGTAGLSGTNEPSLQAILDLHSVNVNVGDDDKNTNIIHSTDFKAPLLGEEVSIQSFKRLTDGPVIIEPLSVFGPQDPAGIVTGLGWYISGQANAKNELFTVSNDFYQSVDPQITGTPVFDPGIEAFGFYSRWPYFNNRHLYSEDALNTFTGAIPHHVRIYPLKGDNGNVIEGSYVVAFEEHVSGFDYQDIAFIVRNVKSATDVVAKTLTVSSPTLTFANVKGTSTPAQSLTIAASAGTPAITVTKSASSDWLVLPAAPALGVNAFGIDATGLAAGSYNATVTIAAAGYTSTNVAVTLNVTAPASQATIAVSSSELIFDALKNTTATRRVTITNTGTDELRIESVTLGGTNPDKFSVQEIVVENVPAGSSIAPEQTKTFDVKFIPGNTIATYNAALTINSNAGNLPSINVGLYAMSLNGYEGSNEPPLQTVVNTLGYKINVGWTTLADGVQPVMKGEEVLIPLFEKAASGPVTITPVARYSPNQELPFGFFTKSGNTPVRTGVGTLSGVFGQHNTLFPQIVAGTDQFSTDQPFGIYVVGLENRLSFSEDALNAGGPALHAVRTYPLRDRQGELVPNSYLVCFEDASNGDYQDYVFVLKNVIPAGSRKELVFDASNLAFNTPLNGTSAAKTITLQARNGTPAAVRFSKSNTSWLVAPSPALGSLSFNVNTAGLTAGVYSTTINAEADGFASAALTISLHVTDVSAKAVKVNYQLATTATPAGYLADIGQLYDDTRGYGWINATTKAPKDNSANMRERSSNTVETRLRTLALMQATGSGQTPGAWEMKVDAGMYNVTVGVGDVGFYDSNHRINVEGTTVISNFIPNAQTPNQIVTATVEVTDGKLTIDATGGTNTKINFVIVDPATAEGDFTPPVAALSLKGTLQSAGVYTNQVMVTVNASDAGGSGLANVLYSINNEAFRDYYGPVIINAAGTYSFRAKAIDGNKNETTSSALSFSVVQTQPSNANMVVENLDKFPANDQLTFSLIQEPWRRTNDDGTFTPYNRNHDVVKARISNKGTAALTISSLALSNPAAWKIATINNVAYDPATAAAITVNPGTSIEMAVQFVAQYPTGRVRILNDTLKIMSNDDVAPRKNIVLRGLWQAAGEGNSEPRASEIISAFGMKSNVGFQHDDGTNTGNSLVLNTDEIMSAYFARADAAKPVSVVQMGAYHGCCASVENVEYFVKGTNTYSTLFTHHGLDGQSLLPLKAGNSNAIAEGSFSPTGLFGFRVSISNSDRTKNLEGKIGLRFWKAVDNNGNVIPNAYIIGHDYIGKPGITNYDYQDNVYYVTNIKPETGTANYSDLASTPSAVDFGSQVVGLTNTQNIDLKNLGLTYANGTTDPSVTIKSVEIAGPNLNEFAVGTATSSSLAPQESTTLTVTFRPSTPGIKNAVLLVNYTSSLSPVRIPLYGIANDNCNLIGVLKRIKGGSDAEVNINGKVWEADRNYRLGSIQLDKPAATPIAATDDDVLYQTYLSAAADLAETRYQIPVANGTYKVRMHFVENFFTAVGSRVFSISLENVLRQSNFDIFREVGYKTALVKDFEVSVTDGRLDVKFNPSVNRVALAGLEIFNSNANPNAVVLTQEAVVGAECAKSNGSITFGVANSNVSSFLYKMGESGSYQTSPVFSNLASGDYTFYVKENFNGGCETSKVFTIPERNGITFTVTAPEMSCSAPSGTATISNLAGGSGGNYTVSWGTTPVQTGLTATNLQPGNYFVTVTDGSGCTKVQQVTVARKANCPVTAIRINSGGDAYLASGNRQFASDAYFGGTNGTSSLPSGDILNTTDDAIYMTERSSASFNYSIPVTNGNWNVILHFAEIWFGAPGRGAGGSGKRAFNVDVEGSRKLTNYDIFAKAGGALRAIQETIPVTITDGIVNINFTAGTANLPKISAIELIMTSPAENVEPELAAIGNKAATVGRALTFTASATDANTGQTKTYSLTDAPAGASINATTGAFTWTPTTAGTFTFTVKVTDNGTPALSDQETITVTVAEAPAPTAIRINAGGAAYLASGNRQFIADTYFGGTDRTGSIATTDIQNTTDDALYLSERSSAGFTYSIPVNNGNWTVVLHFAETYYTTNGTGKRRFNVDMEGSRKLTNYDIFAKAGGGLRAVQETFDVAVADGTLNINFLAGAANLPKVSAIEVMPKTAEVNVAPELASIGNKTVTLGQPVSFTAAATDANAGQTKTFSLVNQPAGAAINGTTGAFTWTPAAAGTFTFTVRVTDNGTPALSDEESITVTVNNAPATTSAIRINAGGAAYLASGNRQFIADTYFGGTDRTGSIATTDIQNTTDDALYLSERSSAGFTYSIPVNNGNWTVVLHFAETYFTTNGTGKRRFNVDMEGSRKLTNYDIFAKAGGGLRAVQETFDVAVADGTLNINFLAGAANLPKVSAIEVVPAAETPVNSTVTLTPQADSYVRTGTYAGANYGNETSVVVKAGSGDGITRTGYMKFALGSLTQVTSAKLRIYGNNTENTTAINLSAYGVTNDSWTETGINLNNAPASLSTALGTVSVNNTAKYYEIDVTNFVKEQLAGDKVVSIALKNPTSQNRNLTFNSKENAANKPQLVIQTGTSAALRTSQEMIAPSEEVVEYAKSQVYPNPVPKRFTVEVSAKHSDDVRLQLISEMGRTYPVALPGDFKAGNKAEVEISNHYLSRGVYLLKVTSSAATEVIRVVVLD